MSVSAVSRLLCLVLAGDANLFRYVGNGPTNATDPSGLDELVINGEFVAWKYSRPYSVFSRKFDIGTLAPGGGSVKLTMGATVSWDALADLLRGYDVGGTNGSNPAAEYEAIRDALDDHFRHRARAQAAAPAVGNPQKEVVPQAPPQNPLLPIRPQGTKTGIEDQNAARANGDDGLATFSAGAAVITAPFWAPLAFTKTVFAALTAPVATVPRAIATGVTGYGVSSYADFSQSNPNSPLALSPDDAVRVKLAGEFMMAAAFGRIATGPLGFFRGQTGFLVGNGVPIVAGLDLGYKEYQEACK